MILSSRVLLSCRYRLRYLLSHQAAKGRQTFQHSIRTSSADARQSKQDEGLIYPDPPNKEHHDRSSYAAYAERVGLDTSTNTYVGTQYEYAVAAALGRFGFDLKRIGGAGDYGIDLLGTWTVPSAPKPLRVLLQCKFSSTIRIGPSRIRELEGAFVGAPPSWRGSGVIGLLVTQKTATKGVRESLGRSHWPMGFISCSPEGEVQQMLWNSRAEEAGLMGLGIGVRHSEDASKQELILTWEGASSSRNSR